MEGYISARACVAANERARVGHVHATSRPRERTTSQRRATVGRCVAPVDGGALQLGGLERPVHDAAPCAVVASLEHRDREVRLRQSSRQHTAGRTRTHDHKVHDQCIGRWLRFGCHAWARLAHKGHRWTMPTAATRRRERRERRRERRERRTAFPLSVVWVWGSHPSQCACLYWIVNGNGMA